jgi:hypothetical protein
MLNAGIMAHARWRKETKVWSTHMLKSLDVENYRGFKSYRLKDLAQVNLLVGKNNSGKTALVEAVHLLTSGGDPIVLSDAAQRRGEVAVFEETGRLTSDLTHFFHGHELSASSYFSLRSDNGFPPLTVRLLPMSEDPSLFEEEEEHFEARPTFGVMIEGAIGFGAGPRDLGLSDRGGLLFHPRHRLRPTPTPSATPIAPTLFVPTEPVLPRRLSLLWRHAVLDSVQSDVIAAMQLIEKSIQQILYLPPEGISRAPNFPRDWYVQSTEFARPIPLGSYGDGVRRLMVLALALARVAEGTLCIDEVDTGLHYSVMADMWRLLVKRAVATRAQVFATTHSWDCLEGLSMACQEDADLRSKVAIHSIDPKLPHSVPFLGDSIIRMVKHQIDPR